ncbi:MAG: response regulator [Verrucomicrobiota bacterium]
MNQNARKILIIEDDHLIASIYKSKFEKAGYEVDVAYDGQTGFYRIHEVRPNVVLLDLMLPQMNGLEILKKIRAQKRFDKLPIFVFTNAYLSEFAHEAAAAGANQVFNKATTTPQHILEAANALLFLPPTVSQGASPPSSPVPSVPFCTDRPVSTGSQPQSWRLAPSTLSSGEADGAFQAELRNTFEAKSTETISNLQEMLKALSETDNQTERLNQLLEFYRKVHSLTGSSAIVQSLHMAQLSSALEALLKELYGKPASLNASTLRTMAEAIDFLATLFSEEKCSWPDLTKETYILVVDDEAISRRAIIYALQKVNLRSVGVDDAQVACNLLSANHFDLVILDVEMPNMNGFQLCRRMRELPDYKNTPVIFVAGLHDFESQAQAKPSPGDDIIAKPFLFMELALKGLMQLFRCHLAKTATLTTTSIK